VKATQSQGPEIHVPEPVVNGLESDVLAAQDVADVDPVAVPADPSVATDEADLVMRELVRE
jgi:hypothetical protein